MTKLYVLFEHAVGYGLFLIKEFEEIGAFLPQVEAAAKDASKFQKVVQLVAFKPFKNSAAALENINAISEGILTNDLSGFLKANFPALGKNKITLGVSDPKLGASINELLNVPVTHVGAVPEIIRGIRFHLTLFVKALTTVSMKQSELGLGHSYSRGKIKFNVNRVDNMIIQSIALIDQLDKDINTFSMRIREWYSYHFPELAKIVTDNYQYALCANFIKDRSSLSNEESKERLEEILMDSSKAQAVLDSARMTMGMDISPIDLMNIEIFAMKVANLANYRKQLAEYLRNKMNAVAPNLSVLIGEVVGARLISRAGSLMSLAKYPASTVQILGAEKALFRALKTRGKTPKYGLIYHSTYIGRAASTNKGRISRYLANKCSLASRIDCFSELPTSVFGQKLKEQVEERMKFYEVGDLPRKNVDVMAEAVQENEEIIRRLHKEKKKKKKQLKRLEEEVNGSADLTEPIESEEPRKIKKKKKASEPSMLMEEAKEEEAITKKRKKRGSEETTKEKPSKKKKSKVKRE